MCGMNFKPQLASRKTTLAGLSAALGALFVGIGYALDDDPKTNADWMSIIGILWAGISSAYLGFMSRDAD